MPHVCPSLLGVSDTSLLSLSLSLHIRRWAEPVPPEERGPCRAPCTHRRRLRGPGSVGSVSPRGRCGSELRRPPKGLAPLPSLLASHEPLGRDPLPPSRPGALSSRAAAHPDAGRLGLDCRCQGHTERVTAATERPRVHTPAEKLSTHRASLRGTLRQLPRQSHRGTVGRAPSVGVPRFAG